MGKLEIITPEEEQEKYILVSKITGKPYLDEENQSYIFAKEDEAKKIIKEKKIENVECKNAKKEKLKHVCSKCYAAGAEYIVFINEKEKTKRKLNERHLEKRYYNGYLNANLSQFLHTRKAKYIENLADCEFIVPIKITNDGSISIVYATVHRKNDDSYMYLAFTDLKGYTEWLQVVKDKWDPLAVDIKGLKRIGKNHGFVIEPLKEKFVLSSKMLSAIKANENEENDD